MLHITIWDHDAKRITLLDHRLSLCAKRLGIRLAINSVSEPPALAREHLMGRVPVLEIAGNFWSLNPGAIPEEAHIVQLLQKLLDSTLPALKKE